MIQVVSTQTKTATNADTTSYTHNIPVRGNSTLIIAVSTQTSGDTGPSPTSVTVGGQSATKLAEQFGSRTYYSFWYLNNPPTGNQTIVVDVTVDGGGNNTTILAVSYLVTNVEELDNEGYTLATASSSTVNTTIDKNGGVTIDVGLQRGSSTLTENASQTEVYNAVLVGSNTNTHFSSYKTNISAGSNSMIWSSNRSDTFMHGVIELVPAPSKGASLLISLT